MSEFDFDRIIDRHGTGSMKWQYFPPEVLPMWVADMDFAAPEPVLAALRQRLEHGVLGYSTATPELLEPVQAWLQAQHHWTVPLEAIVPVPGVVPGMQLAAQLCGEPGAGLLSHTPVYPPFFTIPGNQQRRLQRVPLAETDQGWQHDPDALRAATDASSAGFMLCNPHNPTGRVFSEAELHDVADHCLRHRLLIASDEIWCDLVVDPSCRHRILAAMDAELAASTITLMAPSKTWNIAGLFCSFAIITEPQLRARFQRAAAILPPVNALGLVAGSTAYDAGDDWLRACLAYLWDNLQLVEQTVAAIPGLRMHHSQGTYVAWLDARGSGIAEPGKHCQAYGLGLSDGPNFGAPGFLRLNFGCPRGLLQQGLERLQTAFTETNIC